MFDVVNSYYVLMAVCGAFTLGFGIISVFPITKQEQSTRFALYGAAVAFVQTWMATNLYSENGYYQKSNGVEYNYMRGLVFAFNGAMVALMAGSILWYELVLGWTLVVASTGSLLWFVAAGVSTGNKMWSLFFVCGGGFGLTAMVVLFLGSKNAWNSSYKSSSQKTLCIFWIFSSWLTFLAFAINQILAPEGSGKYGVEVREWFYMSCSLAVLLVILFGVLIYEKVPEKMITEGSATKPSNIVPEGEKPITKQN